MESGKTFPVMKTKKTITTLNPDKPALFDRRLRERVKRIITLAVVFALLGLSAGGLFAFVRHSKTAGVFLEPGLAVPVGLLVIAVVGSVLLRRAAREIFFCVNSDKLYRRPSFWARLAGTSTKRYIALHQVSQIKVIRSPWGNHLVLSCRKEDEMIPVPMNLACPDLYKELYNLLPSESWVDKKERHTLSALGSSIQGSSIHGGSIDGSQQEEPSSSQRSLMKGMGLWTLLSRENWAHLLGSDKEPNEDALMEIWRADRFRLDYSALLSLLDILLPFVGENKELLLDALRLGLTFRIASLVEDALTLLEKGDEVVSNEPESEKSEENEPGKSEDNAEENAVEKAEGKSVENALEKREYGRHIWRDWSEAQKRPPQVKAALPIMGARRYRLDPEQRLLMMGTSETLSIRYITAMCRRNGFLGTRILFIYDVWGQKHEITPANSPEPLDDFAARLSALAPHIMELHEERSWSFGSRLRHRRLKRLLRDSPLQTNR